MRKEFETVDEYIAAQPAEIKRMLLQMRAIIRPLVPKAEEMISYQIPAFKHKGMLVGFGARKNGCSLYTWNGTLLESIKDELESYTYTKSALHFSVDQKLPVTLIKKITRARIKQNKERIALKNKLKKQNHGKRYLA